MAKQNNYNKVVKQKKLDIAKSAFFPVFSKYSKKMESHFTTKK